MRLARGLAAASAAVALLGAAAGCGVGGGEARTGDAELRVTRDYGTQVLVKASVGDPTESETVMRALDREAEVTTRYGGGFVQSINGIAGGVEDGRSTDWFFYVNGVESPAGAQDVPVRVGDRIWWDYRDWTAAMRVPAVVGSFPQPLARPGGGEEEVALECLIARRVCQRVAGALRQAGAAPTAAPQPPGERSGARVLVGPWADLRHDPDAGLIARGPERSGVFAGFRRAGEGWRLEILDLTGDVAASLGSAGLLAALAPEPEVPLWVITGTDEAGVLAAAEALNEDDLRDRYAVVATGTETRPAPGAP